MPTYSYECSECGNSFDILQSILDKKLKKCPKCDKNGLVRLIGSGGGLILKGSGFYETDYKRPAAGACQSKGSKDSSGGCANCPNNS